MLTTPHRNKLYHAYMEAFHKAEIGTKLSLFARILERWISELSEREAELCGNAIDDGRLTFDWGKDA